MIHLIDDKSYDISTCFDFNEHLLAFLTSYLLIIIEYYYIMNIIIIIMIIMYFNVLWIHNLSRILQTYIRNRLQIGK